MSGFQAHQDFLQLPALYLKDIHTHKCFNLKKKSQISVPLTNKRQTTCPPYWELSHTYLYSQEHWKTSVAKWNYKILILVQKTWNVFFSQYTFSMRVWRTLIYEYNCLWYILHHINENSYLPIPFQDESYLSKMKICAPLTAEAMDKLYPNSRYIKNKKSFYCFLNSKGNGEKGVISIYLMQRQCQATHWSTANLFSSSSLWHESLSECISWTWHRRFHYKVESVGELERLTEAKSS